VTTSVTVTADDFGLCPEVNEAVCLLHDRGIVQRTCLMVTTPHFESSVEALLRRPALEVAIHLDLTDGQPVLPAAAVPSLVNRHGRFHGGRHYGVLARIVVGRMSRREIRDEWRAQIVRAQNAGIEIRQLTSHGHVHLLPRLRGVVLGLVEEFAIPQLRVVRSGESVRGLLLRACSTGLVGEATRRGLSVTCADRIIGLGHPGSIDRQRLCTALSRAHGGTVELIVHPAAGRNIYHRRWGYSGEEEMSTLLSDETARLLHQARGR
jgi:predicted glycoside hydrolase/deacetylase ChbG (UPF0249 family)